MEEYVAEIELPCSPTIAAEFFLVPANHLLISPPDLELRWLEAPERLVEDSIVSFEVRAFGIRQRATHQIGDVTPHGFLEVQLRGAPAAWQHRHEFLSSPAGCRCVDTIRFLPPKGVLGLAMTAARIRVQLDRGFRFRDRVLPTLLARSTETGSSEAAEEETS